MSWQNAFIHLGNFLILPLFIGSLVGAFARVVYFRQCSYFLLMIAGFFGCLTGLILGWLITGRDGHMLGYALSLLTCTCFILITSGGMTQTNIAKTKNKRHK